jgi:hypothetical protein
VVSPLGWGGEAAPPSYLLTKRPGEIRLPVLLLGWSDTNLR